MSPPADVSRSTTSTRDHAALGAALRRWFAGALRADDLPDLLSLEVPGKAGNSSDTLLVELRWTKAGEDLRGGYVVRLPPPSDAYPLFPGFPWYDVERQAAALQLVAARSDVPVPSVPWVEPDASVLGAPFFVMERVHGEVVADNPPYVFGSWVTEAPVAARAAMTTAMVDVLAGIHGIEGDLARFELDRAGATPLERHVANQRAYYEWIRAGATYPTIERAFAWLEDHWPDEGEAVLSWGDARPANVLWQGFRPVAVLDWEAVAVGPRELDLGWLVFFHEYFQRTAERYGYVGAPELFRREEVVAAYQVRTGQAVANFDWYLVYAELRQALTSIRVTARRLHLEHQALPTDHEDLIIDREHLDLVCTSGGSDT